MSTFKIAIGYLNYKKKPPNIAGVLFIENILDLPDNVEFISHTKKGKWKIGGFGHASPTPVDDKKLVSMIEIGECQQLEINDELFEEK